MENLINIFLVLMSSLNNCLVRPESSLVNALLFVIQGDIVLANSRSLISCKFKEQVFNLLLNSLEVKHIPEEEIPDPIERVSIVLKQPVKQEVQFCLVLERHVVVSLDMSLLSSSLQVLDCLLIGLLNTYTVVVQEAQG